MIRELAEAFPVHALCATLGVSPSGYYAWRNRAPAARTQADQRLCRQIRVLHAAHRGRYGAPRIRAELREAGVVCSRKRVARLLRQAGLRGVQKRAFRPQTTQSHHDQPIAPNRLPELTCTRPDEIWLGDNTYIPTREGWLYLAGILDRFSRKLKGWQLEEHMREDLTLGALERALATAAQSPQYHHTDQGVQYASGGYRRRLALCGITPSMSRRGNCYDNAMMESFWATLKTELFGDYVPATKAEARRLIFEYIELYYNRRRKHSALGFKSPVDFETQFRYQQN
jgi:transposase InsO family protein